MVKANIKQGDTISLKPQSEFLQAGEPLGGTRTHEKI